MSFYPMDQPFDLGVVAFAFSPFFLPFSAFYADGGFLRGGLDIELIHPKGDEENHRTSRFPRHRWVLIRSGWHTAGHDEAY